MSDKLMIEGTTIDPKFIVESLPLSELCEVMRDMQNDLLEFWAEQRAQQIIKFLSDHDLEAKQARIIEHRRREFIFSVVDPMINRMLVQIRQFSEQEQLL